MPSPFCLKSCLKGVPMQTKSGHSVQFVAYLNGAPAPLLIEQGGEMFNYFADGTFRAFSFSGNGDQDNDLVMMDSIEYNIAPLDSWRGNHLQF